MGNRELLERAFALAESGRVRTIKDIRTTLMREGFTYFDLGQLSGTTLSKQIARAIAAAKSDKSCVSGNHGGQNAHTAAIIRGQSSAGDSF
jgi:hypothetical protein